METYKDITKTAPERANDLLKRMTLTEKVGQMNQNLYGFSVYERDGSQLILSDELKAEVDKYSGLGVLYGLYRADPWSAKTEKNGLTGDLAIEAYNTIQRYVIEHSRLRIPMLLSTECPHGHQALHGYLLPVNLAAGATFHPELLQIAYDVCGQQLQKMGVDFALISMLDVLRDPRWGRSEECFSEDPFLCGEMAKAAVLGMQGQNIIAVAKHFAAQGEGTGGINASAARIGERELREIHLPPMAACCEAGVMGVMAAYNEIDGIPCHANRWLLKDVLQNEMGFRGLVMSDGTAADRLDDMTGDEVSSGALAVHAGVEIGLWNNCFARLVEAVTSGRLLEAEIDTAVLKILTVKFERGLFEQPYLPKDNSDYMQYSYERYEESLNLARESVVLLKNENHLLPLSPDMKSIAVIGPNAHSIYNQLGDYTPPVSNGVTVWEGMKAVADKLPGKPSVAFQKGCNLNKGSLEEMEKVVNLARECDVTVLVLGGSSSRFEQTAFDSNGAAITQEGMAMDCGEGVDTDTLSLPSIQQQLSALVCANAKKVITILIGGRPYAVPKEAQGSDAFLTSFYPGPMGGTAIAEILFGLTNPSGRLPVSMPAKTGQIPVYYNYKSSYTAPAPLYAFGEGQSYGSYTYGDVTLSHKSASLNDIKDNHVTLSFTIENTGSFDTFAVPMLFIKDVQASIVTRVKQLKAFDKLWLPKGSTIHCSFTFTEAMLALWNDKLCYTVENGDFALSLCDGGNEKWSGNLSVSS